MTPATCDNLIFFTHFTSSENQYLTMMTGWKNQNHVELTGWSVARLERGEELGKKKSKEEEVDGKVVLCSARKERRVRVE
ncbi:MAG: hypothetical protein ACREA7_01460 [Nitrosotalea sp.]